MLHRLVVFYQGARRWRHAAEFSELFAGPVRAWQWVPRFEHVLVDQAQARPEGGAGRAAGAGRAVAGVDSTPITMQKVLAKIMAAREDTPS